MRGSIFAVCIGYNAYNSAISLMSYYLFEGGLFVLAWLGLHPLGMNKGDFAYLIALQKGNAPRIIKTIFYHLVVLALIAVLAWPIQYMWVVFFVIAIVLADVYNKYNLFGKSEPTVRAVWKETKESLKELWQEKWNFINKIGAKKTLNKQNVKIKPVVKKTKRKKKK